VIKLVMVNPRKWKEGEILKVKVIRVIEQRSGVWELVLEETKEGKN